MSLPAAPARRSRRPVLFGVLAAVLVILVAGILVLDNVARAAAANLIKDTVRTSLSIPASTPIDVTVGGASVLIQLLSGRLDRVDIASRNLAVGELRGSATLTATGVPLDQDQPIDRARLAVSTDEAGLQKLFAGFTSLPVDRVVLKNGAIELSTTLNVFGTALPVGVTFAPAAKAGMLELTPTSVVVNDRTFTAAQLKETFGSFADTVLAVQNICVASQLPEGFALDTVKVTGTSIVLAISAKSVVLSRAALGTRGSCPAA